MLLADGTRIHETTGYVVWEEDLLGADVVLTIRPGGRIECSDCGIYLLR